MQAARFEYGMTFTLPPDLQLEPWMRNWVYRRRGHPCFVCATAIEMIRKFRLSMSVRPQNAGEPRPCRALVFRQVGHHSAPFCVGA